MVIIPKNIANKIQRAIESKGVDRDFLTGMCLAKDTLDDYLVDKVTVDSVYPFCPALTELKRLFFHEFYYWHHDYKFSQYNYLGEWMYSESSQPIDIIHEEFSKLVNSKYEADFLVLLLVRLKEGRLDANAIMYTPETIYLEYPLKILC